MINIVICEDDKLFLKQNFDYIQKLCTKFNVSANIKCYSDSNIDEEFLKEKISMAFLDIDLKCENGLDIAKTILAYNEWVSIIFITEHSEYAFAAFGVQALGYLMKPVDIEILEKFFQKALAQNRKLTDKTLWIQFYSDYKEINLLQEEIMYIEKVQRKIKIITFIKNFETNDTIQALEAKLGNEFLRINQGIIVNMNEIAMVEKNTIYLKSGPKLRIGRTYLKNTKEIYNKFIENK